MPYLRREVLRRRLSIHPYLSQIPTSTPAFQAGCFYGTNEGIPGFQFFDKRTGQFFRMGRTDRALAVQESLPGPGLLQGGSVYSCVFDGGASGSLFVFSSLLDPTRWRFALRLWDLFILGLLHAGILLRIVLLALFELLVAVVQFPMLLARTGRFLSELKLITVRVGLLIIGREMITLNTIMDIQRGVPVIYTNYLGYDEMAHYRGPDSASAKVQLRAIDRCVRRICREVRRGARPYRIVILSDHGQAACVPFDEVEGKPVADWLEELLDRCAARPDRVVAECANDEGASPAADQAEALRRILPSYPGPLQRPMARVATALERRGAPAVEEPDPLEHVTDGHGQVGGESAESPPVDSAVPDSLAKSDGIEGPVVVAISGPTAHAYWTGQPRPLLLVELVQHYPGLVEAILNSDGVGCITARGSVPGEVIVLSRHGRAVLHGDGTRTVEGSLPPDRTAHPQHAYDGLRRVTLMDRAGDLILWGNGAPAGEVSYLHERGCHAGFSDEETQAFVLAGADVQTDFSAFRRHAQFYEALRALRPPVGGGS